MRHLLRLMMFLTALPAAAQLMVARDTITVIENGRTLKLAWANGINHSNVSNMDLNGDNKKDLVVFDRINSYGVGRFRCFINIGNAGETRYRHDPAMSYYFPRALYWAILRDYNGDGKEDLFCSTTGGIKVYKNTGTPQHRIQFKIAYNLLLSDYSSSGNPNISNLYASSVGFPGIADLDKDGDLDVLSFSALGVFSEFHQNMRIEKNLHADSLVFRRADYCWGDFSESSCSVTFDACEGRMMWDSLAEPAKPYHAGACITCIDSDGDQDQDLLIGDIECRTIQYVHNSGSTLAPVFSDSTKLYPNFPAKNSNGTYVNMNIFPCAYNVDVDGDNTDDLVATPNAFGTENFESVWYYRNASSGAVADFQFAKKNLLQDEMIEVGQNSYPALIDYNNDGLKDLLIGNWGYYINGTQRSRLTLYRNTGSAAMPVFSLVTRDYAGLSTYSLNNIMPAVGDVDKDGDIDICIGTSSGQIHWLQNSAGPGKACNFSVLKINPFNFTAPSAVAAPQLFDLDSDGKLDLIVGMKNGRVAFYRQTSSGTSITFSLVTSTLGAVNVNGESSLFGTDGFAVPFFFREGGKLNLLCGSITGFIFMYEVANINSPFILLNGQTGFNEGLNSAPWFEDINNDGRADLFLGNGSGGLSFFSSRSPVVGITENTQRILSGTIFPNPAGDVLNVETEPENTEERLYSIFDIHGKMISSGKLSREKVAIDVSAMPPALYMIRISSSSGDFGSWKFIKQ
jgi:hypothetical protein